jgi:hypothetical protein
MWLRDDFGILAGKATNTVKSEGMKMLSLLVSCVALLTVGSWVDPEEPLNPKLPVRDLIDPTSR